MIVQHETWAEWAAPDLCAPGIPMPCSRAALYAPGHPDDGQITPKAVCGGRRLPAVQMADLGRPHTTHTCRQPMSQLSQTCLRRSRCTPGWFWLTIHLDCLQVKQWPKSFPIVWGIVTPFTQEKTRLKVNSKFVTPVNLFPGYSLRSSKDETCPTQLDHRKLSRCYGWLGKF